MEHVPELLAVTDRRPGGQVVLGDDSRDLARQGLDGVFLGILLVLEVRPIVLVPRLYARTSEREVIGPDLRRDTVTSI